jgi:hypothetical protein
MRIGKFVSGLLAVATLLVGAGLVAAANGNFAVHLNGRSENPANTTTSQGQATFKLNDAGTELQFKVNVANIESVTQAHIHCGSESVNGPIVAFLYGLNPAGVSPDGLLAEGTITAANVMVRPDSPECPGGVANFADLVAKIQNGDAYVNVHTIALPGGQIRGQFR